jgi:hypothetical protein
MGARKRLYDHIKNNGPKLYSGKELREIGKISEWARVLRQLKQDAVINYDVTNNQYNVLEINDYSKTTSRSGLTVKDKYRIRNRDGHRCQSCGKGVNDNIKLHIDHKIPLDCGGGHADDNLWTLCEGCNLGKKSHYEDDLDPSVMTLVFQQKSGYQRLRVLFKESPNIKFSPSILQGIAGVRDWTRSVRKIRKKYAFNIVWYPPTETDSNGYYVNEDT